MWLFYFILFQKMARKSIQSQISPFFSFLEKKFAKFLNFTTKKNTTPENLLKIIQTTQLYLKKKKKKPYNLQC
jgi:hypothetical protein